MAELTGKTALVTGASSGIGRESARALAREGANVAISARRESRLDDLATTLEADHDVAALAVPTDVRENEQVTSMVERTVDHFGGLDVALTNAGISGVSKPIEDTSDEEYHRLMRVNVDGMFYTARAVVPHLRESAGNLIFIGSFSGQYPRPGSAVYAGSKWWTRGFAHSLAGDVGEEDIGVTVINPAEVRTEIGSGDLDPATERHDPGEVSEPETVAEAVAFAASQTPPDVVHELDLYRRDKLSHF